MKTAEDVLSDDELEHLSQVLDTLEEWMEEPQPRPPLLDAIGSLVVLVAQLQRRVEALEDEREKANTILDELLNEFMETAGERMERDRRPGRLDRFGRDS